MHVPVHVCADDLWVCGAAFGSIQLVKACRLCVCVCLCVCSRFGHACMRLSVCRTMGLLPERDMRTQLDKCFALVGGSKSYAEKVVVCCFVEFWVFLSRFSISVLFAYSFRETVGLWCSVAGKCFRSHALYSTTLTAPTKWVPVPNMSR